jgi:glycosyltransferase involved in cell wall biosynthesis
VTEAGGGRVAVIHHGFIPIYRVGFYARLAACGPREYVIFHGDAPPNSGHIAVSGDLPFPNVRVANHDLRLVGRTLVYQPLVREILTGGYDAVVMAAQLRFASNHLLHALMKARRRPVVFWGHGRTDQQEDADGPTSTVLRAAARIRALHARLADVYFAYTPGGVERLVGLGVHAEDLIVVPNTIDTDEQAQLRQGLEGVDEAALRRELGLRPDSRVLVYLGRVYREKRLDQLLEALRRLRERGLVDGQVELVVIGDGPELPEIRALAADLPGVHLVGAVADQELIARYLRVGLALVIPGGVGLAVNHAFALGRPVITRVNRLHGGEVEYIEDGINGLVVGGDLDAFVEALAGFLGSEEMQRRLADGALRTSERLTLDAMVRAFDDGVARVLAG